MQYGLTCALALLLSVAGCSTLPRSGEDAVNVDSGRGDMDPTTIEVDPGMPPSEFGTKCYVEMVDEALNTKIVVEDCTASAASAERTSHVYLILRRLPAASQRLYVSLVLGATPLAVGVHTGARAGAIETTLSDGRTFSAGDVKKDGSLQLDIETAATNASSANIYYLAGTLEATLVNVQDASSKLRFRCWINRPITP